MADFTMPSLGADMDSGTLVEWLVAPGDVVHRGDIVAVVDTSKSAVEVETFTEGVVEELLVPVGTQVPVGTPLARIGEARPTGGAAPVAAAVAAAPAAPAAPVTVGHRRRITPHARRLAADLGIDLDSLPGEGRVSADDVRRAAEAQAAPSAPSAPSPPPPQAGPPEGATRMRAAIADLMARSKREVPHYYVTSTIDLGAVTDWLTARNLDLPVARRIVPAAALLKATALTARAHPELNGFWRDGAFVPATGVHLGIAISLRGGGLVAPAIHDAADLSVDDLMAALRDLVTRARAGRLRSSEVSDPTLTVTDLGDQGVESVLGVIYPPQVALVGLGRVMDRPVAVDGLLGVRPTVTATLSADHRATDGMVGSRFLSTLDRLLQAPEDL